MRYLWQQPVRMENRLLLEILGFEPHTPLETALTRTLASLGCLLTDPTPEPVLQG